MSDPSSKRANPADSGASPLSQHIGQNIETIVALRRSEWEQTSPSQRRLERISRFIGRPMYLLAIMIIALAWISWNLTAPRVGLQSFDPLPFSILQGLLTMVALLTTTVVLISQNRQTKIEQQHSHLDLQVNLLTEQKVSKLILLIEELRHDLPMVKDRHDAQAFAMQKAADAVEVAEAIKEVGLTAQMEEDEGTAEQKDS